MLIGPLMWTPGLNIVVGLIAYGIKGGLVGLIVTLLTAGGGASSPRVRRAARSARSSVKQWWDVLGVKPDASDDEIKRAYRAKAKRAHPDLGGSTKDMEELNAARAAAARRA